MGQFALTFATRRTWIYGPRINCSSSNNAKLINIFSNLKFCWLAVYVALISFYKLKLHGQYLLLAISLRYERMVRMVRRWRKWVKIHGYIMAIIGIIQLGIIKNASRLFNWLVPIVLVMFVAKVCYNMVIMVWLLISSMIALGWYNNYLGK